MDFKRHQENSIKSLGLGYGDKLKTNAWKILEFIKSKGEEGASGIEIQKFDWILSGKSEKDFYKKKPDVVHKWGTEKGRRISRGWGIGKLYGSGDRNVDRGSDRRPRIGLLEAIVRISRIKYYLF